MQGQGSVGGIGMGMALDNNAGQGQGQGQHPFMQQQSMSVGGSRAGYGNGQQGTSHLIKFPLLSSVFNTLPSWSDLIFSILSLLPAIKNDKTTYLKTLIKFFIYSIVGLVESFTILIKKSNATKYGSTF